MKTLAVVLVSFFTITSIYCQDDAKSVYQNGNTAFSEKQYEKALGLYEQAIKIGITDSIDLSWILGYAGICCEELNQPEKAKDYYTKSISYGFPNTSIYNKMYLFCKKNNDVDGQEFSLLNMKKKFADETDNVNNKLQVLYTSTKDNIKLLDLYEEMINRDSTDYSSLVNKGNILAQMNKTELAKDCYVQALKIKPDGLKPNMYLGLLLYNQGSAIYEHEKAKYAKLKSPSQNDYVQYQRNVMKGNNFYNEAEPYLLKAYSIEPDKNVKKALYTLYDRLNQPAKAQKYK